MKKLAGGSLNQSVPLPAITVRLFLRDGDGSRARGEVTLNSNDLVVVLSQLQAHLGPSIKVLLGGDSAAAALVVANGPVLLKSRGSYDAGRIGASCGRNLVRAAVGRDASLHGRRRGGVIGAEVLNDWSCQHAILSSLAVSGILTVVLDERVSGPSVDREVRVSVGLVCALVVDVSRGTSCPSLTTNEIAATGPFDAVASCSTVGVSYVRTAVSPEGVVKAVIVSSARRCAALDKLSGSTLGDIGGCGKGTCESNRSREEGGE